MRLEEVIKVLESAPRDRVVAHGLGKAMSYRGYYDQLAFEPKDNVTVGEMLDEARSAVDKVFDGYKGGEYKMYDFTECWIAEYGDCGDALSADGLRCMIGECAAYSRGYAEALKAAEGVVKRYAPAFYRPDACDDCMTSIANLPIPGEGE